MESTRVDRWLWAVRLTKTRTDATAACRAGHVRVNDRPAKPATTVAAGDEVRIRVAGSTRIVDVVRVIEKRVGAAGGRGVPHRPHAQGTAGRSGTRRAARPRRGPAHETRPPATRQVPHPLTSHDPETARTTVGGVTEDAAMTPMPTGEADPS